MKYFLLLLLYFLCINPVFSDSHSIPSNGFSQSSKKTSKFKQWKQRILLKIIQKKISKIAQKRSKKSKREKTSDERLTRKAQWAFVLSILGLLFIFGLIGIIFTIISSSPSRHILRASSGFISELT
jgi:thiol:disulfide interchange protein